MAGCLYVILRSTLGVMLTTLQAFALAKMRGVAGLGGWRWIFILVNLSHPILNVMLIRPF